jgi:TetR/AcrR family transcriptional regulator, lmrAB and yxaGH operons repressor
MNDARLALAWAAAHSLSRRALATTTLTEIVTRSGTARGSLYHFYPGGKDQLVEDGLRLVDEWVLARFRAAPVDDPAGAAAGYVAVFRDMLDHDRECDAGCPFATLVVDDAPEAFRVLAADAYTGWRGGMAAGFARAGLGSVDADAMASLVLAACEGALLLSRAERDPAAFDTVVATLLADARLRPSPDPGP